MQIEFLLATCGKTLVAKISKTVHSEVEMKCALTFGLTISDLFVSASDRSNVPAWLQSEYHLCYYFACRGESIYVRKGVAIQIRGRQVTSSKQGPTGLTAGRQNGQLFLVFPAHRPKTANLFREVPISTQVFAKDDPRDPRFIRACLHAFVSDAPAFGVVYR